MAEEKRIKAVIQLRRALKKDWEELNPVLRIGEPGFEIDTGRLKIGDANTPWKNLPYIGGSSTFDYDVLINKPSIEGVELIGDKAINELGVDTLSVQEIEKILYLGG